MARPRKYGLFKHLLDFALVLATGGAWLIWIVIRYYRINSPIRK